MQPLRLGRRRASSLGVIVDSHLPHLVDLSDDLLSTGVLIYHLQEGTTRAGADGHDTTQDICKQRILCYYFIILQFFVSHAIVSTSTNTSPRNETESV